MITDSINTYFIDTPVFKKEITDNPEHIDINMRMKNLHPSLSIVNDQPVLSFDLEANHFTLINGRIDYNEVEDELTNYDIVASVSYDMKEEYYCIKKDIPNTIYLISYHYQVQGFDD